MIMKACFYIVQHRQFLKQTNILKGSCSAGLIDFNGAPACYVHTVQLNASGIGLVYTCQKVKHRGLSSSVRAYKAIKLPLLNPNIKIVNCL